VEDNIGTHVVDESSGSVRIAKVGRARSNLRRDRKRPPASGGVHLETICGESPA
jgi:hypothetical protein